MKPSNKRPLHDAKGLDLETATREELISRIKELESADSLAVMEGKKKRTKVLRPFDINAYPKKHLALKIAYLGWDYHGYASQISFQANAQVPVDISNLSACPTIEEALFKAMMTARLVESPGSANYSRCGRTDAGVSATGQVIGCTVRCSGSKLSECGEVPEAIDLPIQVILNGILPPEIRVLQVCEAPEGFNARFDCKYREYHYYFPKGNLDIGRMSDAASRLKGSHDFRNFCKKDPSKEIQNYVRTVLKSQIEPVGDSLGFDQMYRYVIRGTAFLYHQVRCTMAVLYLVGEGKEVPDIIDYLIRPENLLETWRPTYQMASEIPLVLVECGFDKVNFDRDSGGEAWRHEAQLRNQKHFYGLWRKRIVQALTIQSLISGSVEDSCKQVEENRVFSYRLRRN